ncbi:tyrosine-type recombinase/integrase [Microbacterium phyllosphaerae]
MSVLGDITWREPPTGDRVTYCSFDIDSFSRIRISTPRRHAPSGRWHSLFSWMALAGIALHVLQEILGHQSIETTKGYLHPDHRHLAEAARQANQFLSAAPTRRDPARRDGPHL